MSSRGCLLLAVVGQVACGPTPPRAEFTVEEGGPTVLFDPSMSGAIEEEVVSVDPGAFAAASSEPNRRDTFTQPSIHRVDLLFVIDDSCSMSEEQAALPAKVGDFVNGLSWPGGLVDYHLGVITTSAPIEEGALRELLAAPAERFIACNPDGVAGCNVPDPLMAFEQLVQVGTSGAAREKGLLATYLALTEPMVSDLNQGFLRDDAELHVIIVSDEGDVSCGSMVTTPPGTDWTSCSVYPGCSCDEAGAGYLDPGYWVRAFETLKGLGHGDRIAVSAIVATEARVLPPDTNGKSFLGCEGPHGQAYHAPRYLEVASRTGGRSFSVCELETSSAFSLLAREASAPRDEFPLSSSPILIDGVPFSVVVQADPLDPSTRVDVPRASANPAADGGWTYVHCEGGFYLQLLRFSGVHIPPPGALIEVTYRGDPSAGRVCS